MTFAFSDYDSLLILQNVNPLNDIILWFCDYDSLLILQNVNPLNDIILWFCDCEYSVDQ